MKDIGQPNYGLRIQFEYLSDGILISQSNYTKKILKQFNMHNLHPISLPMGLRSLDLQAKDTCKKRCENEQTLRLEKSYLFAIRALNDVLGQLDKTIYINFAVSFLSRHSSQFNQQSHIGTK